MMKKFYLLMDILFVIITYVGIFLNIWINKDLGTLIGSFGLCGSLLTLIFIKHTDY